MTKPIGILLISWCLSVKWNIVDLLESGGNFPLIFLLYAFIHEECLAF